MKKAQILLSGILATVILFGQAGTIHATGTIVNKGYDSFYGENYDGCTHYKSEVTWNWLTVDGRFILNYNWSSTGSYSIYDLCHNNQLTNSGTWYGRGHQLLLNNQMQTYYAFSKSANGEQTITQRMTFANGEVKMDQVWLNGKKIN